jgi:DNA (cytosine-5)-methyltransferase 1
MVKYLSVCSGIEAASVAWKDLDWQAVGYSEIEPYPSAVLQHHYPSVKNFGNMLESDGWDIERFDLLVGGTPCQSFSINGLRKGLEDDRGNLALTYCRILAKWRPRWFLWENVPGVLSSSGGRDFFCLTRAMAELGYGFCYRVLDARYFGVPQNRRRVFIVGHLGDYRPAAEVLLEPESMCRLSDSYSETGTDSFDDPEGPQGSAGGKSRLFRQLRTNRYKEDGRSSTLAARDWKGARDLVLSNGRIRRPTPREYERLMGFPDDYTRIPFGGQTADQLNDKHRFKALGNSMAVPVMRWLGKRIDYVNYRRTF